MAEHVEATFEVIDKASAGLRAAQDKILFPKRLKALQFAASLRGARDEGEAVSWMEQRGYAQVEVTSQGDYVSLTEEGVERADGIIKQDPEMFER